MNRPTLILISADAERLDAELGAREEEGGEGC